MPTYVFESVRRQVQRTIPCGLCGAPCKRTFVGECTINPYNKNDAGETCSRAEVAAKALAQAERLACRAEADGIECQWCSERAPREALIRFLDGEPLPDRQWGNATHTLLDRKNIEEGFAQKRCEHCGEESWKSKGYTLTSKGRALAERLKEKARSRGEYPFAEEKAQAA